jgi:DNA polymerase-3 subunit delta
LKLPHYQLEQHLTTGKLAPVYIISGEELLLKQEVLQLIRKTAQRLGFTDRVRLAPEAGFNWEQLYTLLYSPSMLAEKQCIELDFREQLPNKTASSILAEYATNPSPHHLLLINLGKIDNKIHKCAWYLALEKIGMLIPIWPIARKQLPAWINQRARKQQLQCTAEAVNLLAEYVEGNLSAAAAAIEKLSLLGLKTVNKEDIKQVLTDESHFTIFDLTDSLIASDKSRTFHVLQQLQEEGIEPILVLWAITREFRVLAEMAHALQQGSNYDALWKKHRVFAQRQPLLRQFLNTHSMQDCWQALVRAMQIDHVIKGVVTGSVWQELEIFCLGIHTPRTNPLPQ